MEKSPKYPFKKSSGEFKLPDGSFVKYCISTENNTIEQPVSLTFQAFNADRTPTNLHTTDSTLYFDASARIVDRAPMNIYLSARKLKEMYGDALLQSIAIGSDEYKLIAGFFEPGDVGIRRRKEFVMGKIRKTLIREDI